MSKPEDARKEADAERRTETLLHLSQAQNWRRPPLEIELLQFLDQAAADAVLAKQKRST